MSSLHGRLSNRHRRDRTMLWERFPSATARAGGDHLGHLTLHVSLCRLSAEKGVASRQWTLLNIHGINILVLLLASSSH